MTENAKELHISLPHEIMIFDNAGSGNEVWVGGTCLNSSVSFCGARNRVFITRGNCGRGTVSIQIEGDENEVRIGDLQAEGNVTIRCQGNRGRVEIVGLWVHEWMSILNGSDLAHVKSEGAVCCIGEGVTVESITILNHHSHGEIVIGDGCMIGNRVMLMNSDTHPIYGMETGEIINRPVRPLKIGENVWLGMNATVLKGTSVPAGSIVGCNATVAHSFHEKNVVLAGCPARVVKRRVFWKVEDACFV